MIRHTLNIAMAAILLALMVYFFGGHPPCGARQEQPATGIGCR